MKILRIRFSITLGNQEAATTPTGPDAEAQIGTHHDAGHTDTGLGFYSPATTPLGDDE